MFDILLLVFQILRQLCVVGILCGDGIDTNMINRRLCCNDNRISLIIAICVAAVIRQTSPRSCIRIFSLNILKSSLKIYMFYPYHNKF